MPVTVDDSPLSAEELGLKTVGQVLAHLQRKKRLVVHVLIDGCEPDFRRLGEVRQSTVENHNVYIETADPLEMAMEVLHQVEGQIFEADRIKGEAAKLLQTNQNAGAMEKLAGCLTTWHHAQESLLKTARLMKIDLDKVLVSGEPLKELIAQFADQLKQIRSALENRDFVTLSDVLIYETEGTGARWREAIETLRRAIGSNAAAAV